MSLQLYVWQHSPVVRLCQIYSLGHTVAFHLLNFTSNHIILLSAKTVETVPLLCVCMCAGRWPGWGLEAVTAPAFLTTLWLNVEPMAGARSSATLPPWLHHWCKLCWENFPCQNFQGLGEGSEPASKPRNTKCVGLGLSILWELVFKTLQGS